MTKSLQFLGSAVFGHTPRQPWRKLGVILGDEHWLDIGDGGGGGGDGGSDDGSGGGDGVGDGAGGGGDGGGGSKRKWKFGKECSEMERSWLKRVRKDDDECQADADANLREPERRAERIEKTV